MKLSREDQRKTLQSHKQTLKLKQQRLKEIINAVDDYLSGEELFNLSIFKNSEVLELKEQYYREAKLVYGETEKYKEYERNIAKIPDSKKDVLYDEFQKNTEKIFKKLSQYINEAPSSNKVQKLIEEWKSHMGNLWSVIRKYLYVLQIIINLILDLKNT